MTVGQLVEFLSDYGEDCDVVMLQTPEENPLIVTTQIADAIAIDSAVTKSLFIALIPKQKENNHGI